MRRLEKWIVGIWYEGQPIPLLLRGFSWVYARILGWQQRRVSHLRSLSPHVPVIVVGNLVAGGTGKSPVVAAIARHFLEEGFSVAIISRGHVRKLRWRRASEPKLVEVGADPDEVGDEALMLATDLGCPVWVCPDRLAALNCALANGAKVVIGDDGLQHARLPRSMEICVIDGQRGFGNGHLLPAGPLREPISRLDTVDEILIKGPGYVPTKAHLRFDLLPVSLYRVHDEKVLGPASLSGQAVIGLCAIANPLGFQQTLEQLGMQVVLEAFGDHYVFQQSQLNSLPAGKPIVVTEKDWAKLGRLEWSDSLRSRLHVLRVRAGLPGEFLERITAHVRNYKHD